MVLDSTTGECLAIIDGAVLTRARTAAATAVATDALANPDASTLGLVGAGRLAIEHVAAIRVVRPISRVCVWSRSADTLAAFRTAVGADLDVTVASSPRDVVASADIVCTLTPSRTPIVSGAWFHPRLHLNAVGAPPRADHREIDSAGMAGAKVFVDSPPPSWPSPATRCCPSPTAPPPSPISTESWATSFSDGTPVESIATTSPCSTLSGSRSKTSPTRPCAWRRPTRSDSDRPSDCRPPPH